MYSFDLCRLGDNRMRARLHAFFSPQLWRASSARRLRARVRRDGEGGFTLIEMVVTLFIVSLIIPVTLAIVTNLFQQSQDLHDTMTGVQQDQIAGEALVQYLHSTIVILPGSNATTLKASLLAGVNSSSTAQTATLLAVLTNSVNPKLDATFTTSLTPDGGTSSSVSTYDAVNSTTVFTYYYNNYSATPVGLATTTAPTNSQLSEIVAIGIDVTFLAGPHVPTQGFQSVRPSSFETTVYLQNAAGAPAPTSSVAPPTWTLSGSTLTITATVTPVPDGGNVTFSVTDGSGNPLPLCAAPVDVNASSPLATCSFTTSGGTYYVSAAFSGTSDMQPSTSTSSKIVVPIVTTTNIYITPSSGQLSIQAVVSAADQSTPTGSVSFKLTGGACYPSCTTVMSLVGGSATWVKTGLSNTTTYTATGNFSDPTGTYAPSQGTGSGKP